MKHVLMILDGDVGMHFLHKTLSDYSNNNLYIVIYKNRHFEPKESPSTFRFYKCDYTSFFNLDNILRGKDIFDAFIVLNDERESKVIYEYLRKKYEKSRIIKSIHAMNKYYENLAIRDSNLVLITQTNAMVSRLLLRVPNTPVIPRGFGLEQGEIMEIGVPSGSILAYRQVSTITQTNWRIVGLYRRGEFILVSSQSIIQPGDGILAVGRPESLKTIFNHVKSDIGQFPLPFGLEIYLVLDMAMQSKERILFDCAESMFLHKNLKSNKLTIKVLNPTDFRLIKRLESFNVNNISVMIDYDNLGFEEMMRDQINKKVGLIIVGQELFNKRSNRRVLWECKTPVFKTGLNALGSDFEELYSKLESVCNSRDFDLDSNSQDSRSDPGAMDYVDSKINPKVDSSNNAINVAYSFLVIAGDYRHSSDISTIIFDISKQLRLNVEVYDFEPDNHFNREIEDEFSNLSRIFERKFHIQKSNTKNPIFYLQDLKVPLLHFLPFTNAVTKSRFSSFFRTNFEALAFILDSNPQFYLPVNE